MAPYPNGQRKRIQNPRSVGSNPTGATNIYISYERNLMFKSVFKCRLCQGIVEVPISNREAKNIANRVMGIADPLNPPDNPKQIHKCRNGSRGIMDLQGFRFYGDE